MTEQTTIKDRLRRKAAFSAAMEPKRLTHAESEALRTARACKAALDAHAIQYAARELQWPEYEWRNRTTWSLVNADAEVRSFLLALLRKEIV